MNNALYTFTLGLLIAATALCVTGCYRMPTGDDHCVIPVVNNRDITREKAGSGMPSLKY